jgi:hypothetical protein
MDAEKKETPVCETEAGATSNDLNATATDAGAQEAIKQTSAPSKNEEKQESWFPVARKDIAKIRRNHQAAEGDRLIALWCCLVSLANNYKTNAVRQTLAQIGNAMCISKRETVKRALLNLERMRLLKITESKRGQGGRYEVSIVTLKPASPCFATSNKPCPIDGEPDTVKSNAHHVRSTNAVERVTKNTIQESLKGPPVDSMKKESFEGDLGANAIAPLSPQDSKMEKKETPPAVSDLPAIDYEFDNAAVFGNLYEGGEA